ncbi:MAG: ANTAR domain-containing protein [Nocardioides sp.]|nr:ANTAR domain-containing protein [Nocardioides sp.]
MRTVPCELVIAVPGPSATGTTQSEKDLDLYATQAGWFMAGIDRLENLHRAMATRATIARAQGMLMVHYDIDASQAFLVMRRRSQDTNVRLAEIAAGLVAMRPVDLGSAL